MAHLAFVVAPTTPYAHNPGFTPSTPPPPQHTRAHAAHQAPYSKNFGIVSGLSNFFLNPVLHPDNYHFYAILTMWALCTVFDVVVIEQLVPPVAPATSSIFSAVANSTIYSAIEL